MEEAGLGVGGGGWGGAEEGVKTNEKRSPLDGGSIHKFVSFFPFFFFPLFFPPPIQKEAIVFEEIFSKIFVRLPILYSFEML